MLLAPAAVRRATRAAVSGARRVDRSVCGPAPPQTTIRRWPRQEAAPCQLSLGQCRLSLGQPQSARHVELWPSGGARWSPDAALPPRSDSTHAWPLLERPRAARRPWVGRRSRGCQATHLHRSRFRSAACRGGRQRRGSSRSDASLTTPARSALRPQWPQRLSAERCLQCGGAGCWLAASEPIQMFSGSQIGAITSACSHMC